VLRWRRIGAWPAADRTPTMDSRLLLRVVLVAALAVSVLASAALAAEPPAGAGSAVSKAAAQIRSLPHAKKKKKKRRKLCVVKRLVNGKLRPVYTHTYVYKFVKRNGVRTRVIRRVRVKMRARCSKACVKTKRRGLRIVTVFKKRKIKVKIVRHNRIVTVKRKRKVPVLVACPKNRSNTVLGTPVTITLLPGSTADLDFQAFTRTTGLSGSVKGYSPGKINLNSDVNFTFTSARLNIDPAAIFIDDACNGEVSASIQTNPNTYAILDSSKDSSGTLSGSNIVASQALILRVPLDLRNDDTGCHNPYLTTGYSEMKFRVVLGGKLGTSNGSLVANLRSSSQFVDADACLQLGDPKLPCSGLQIPFPFFVATHVIGRIDLGKYGTIKL
jgi:hypothetical protein